MAVLLDSVEVVSLRGAFVETALLPGDVELAMAEDVRLGLVNAPCAFLGSVGPELVALDGLAA